MWDSSGVGTEAERNLGPGGGDRHAKTYTYNDEGSIAFEQDSLGATSTYINDANGNRLITRDATGTTLSIGDLELHLAPNNRFPTGVRFYSFNGQKVAERGYATGLTWALSDHQGTTYASIDSDNLAVTQRRQDPFGNARGTAGLWPDRHGFVGGIQDASGLTQLGARGYDSATGRFTQADPVLDPGDPQAMNGYAYSKNTPITGADPSGLATACTDGAEVCETYNPHGGGKCPGGYCEHTNYQALDQAKRASTGNTPSTTPTQNASPQPERSSCSWWEVVCSIEQHMTVFIAVVTVVAVAATVACAIMTAGTCLIAVAAGATEGAMWGGTGMLIGAAVSAGAEVVGALAVAGGAGLAAAEVAEVASADAGKIDGAGSNAVAKAASTETSGVKAGESETPSAEPPTGERPSEDSGTSEPAGCKNSFAAGTAVLMADGSSKPIQDVHVGDQITNKDPKTGQVQTHTVMATHITDDDTDFVGLTIQTSNGPASIMVTAHHLFWDSTAHVWTAADGLNPGDELDTPGGGHAAVASVRPHIGNIRTFNLTVDGVHTYFVFVGIDAVLVHNCPDGGKYGTLRPAGQGNEINHMPQNASTPISQYSGPAVRMSREDHRALYSTGTYLESKAWLMMQRELVDAGRIDEAMMNDINDVLARFPYKYNNAIGEMIGSLAKNAAYQAARTVPSNVSVQLTLW